MGGINAAEPDKQSRDGAAMSDALEGQKLREDKGNVVGMGVEMGMRWRVPGGTSSWKYFDSSALQAVQNVFSATCVPSSSQDARVLMSDPKQRLCESTRFRRTVRRSTWGTSRATRRCKIAKGRRVHWDDGYQSALKYRQHEPRPTTTLNSQPMQSLW